VSAAGAFPGFAHGGTEADGKREIAAFFAHVTFETGCKDAAATAN
jgi:chitinase